MQEISVSSKKQNLLLALEVMLLFLIITLAYAPNLGKLTVYRDDWYYILDRTKGGADVFTQMFSIDRPARGPFFEAYYQVFGFRPLYYHLASFAWRLAGGLAALWLFRQLWPSQRQATLIMAILFAIYPGYFAWVAGIENQPQIASLVLEVVSFALTLSAIGARGRLAKLILWALSILTGWGYLALVDFSIGMEFFRLLCVYIYIRHSSGRTGLRESWRQALRAWVPAVLIPAGFLFWRLFIFNNTRPDTDVSLQLGSLLASPGLKGAWWLVRFLQSYLNESLLAWFNPMLQSFFGLRLKLLLPGLVIAAASGLTVWLAITLMRKADREITAETGDGWQVEAILAGAAGVAVGVLPVVMANRYVVFELYSHYSLPASLASACFITGLIYSLRNGWSRLSASAMLVLLAVLAQYTYSTQVAQEQAIISRFWQQVAWRAPSIRSGSMLLVKYPGVEYGEDVEAVYGPANFIYYPGPSDSLPVQYGLYAFKDTPWSSKDALTGGQLTWAYRTHGANANRDQVLVISQPGEATCAHVLDSRWPWTSYDDSSEILVAAESSDVSLVSTQGQSPVLEEPFFAPMPAQEWCYYFEKADLAVQAGQWQQAADLGAQALQLGFLPADPVEWLPFVQAYAALGDVASLEAAASRLNSNPYNRMQACQVLHAMSENGVMFEAGVMSKVQELFCSGLSE